MSLTVNPSPPSPSTKNTYSHTEECKKREKKTLIIILGNHNYKIEKKTIKKRMKATNKVKQSRYWREVYKGQRSADCRSERA